jgi:beta-glucosidase
VQINRSLALEEADLNQKISRMIVQMTLAEKIGQMLFTAPEIERLGLPAYNWWNEALHGLGRAGVATVFPQAIGLAATWDPALMRRVADAISDEARAKHHAAVRRGLRQIYSGITFWSPNINIFRDPRWGRGQETYGEDPYLTAAMAIPFIQGLQGDDPHSLKVAAAAKHFAVHSGPEADRHTFDAQVSQRDLFDTYLPAFEATVKVGRVEAVMGAYNRTNGEPCCASPTLLQEILRERWGFAGHVVSDCEAITDIYAHHQVVNTAAEAAALAVNNGCDLECGCVFNALGDAVAAGLIDEAMINQAVARLLRTRLRLGLVEDADASPYATIPYEKLNCTEHRALALDAARASIVLLKNDGLLPLAKSLKSVAVVGPNADDLMVLLGNYNGTPAEGATLLSGVRDKLDDGAKLYYARGCPLADGVPNIEAIPSACLRPSAAEAGATGLTGAYFATDELAANVAGTAVTDGKAIVAALSALDGPEFTRTDQVIDFVWKDTSPINGEWGARFAVRWTGSLLAPASGTYQIGVSGHNAYRLWLDGELLVENADIHHAILRLAEVELEAGRLYDIRLEYANWGLDPQVRLVWARAEVDEMPAALEAAEKADVIIAALGLSPRIEGEEFPVVVEGFDGDRTNIELPAAQEKLLRALGKLGKPLVLVLMSGSAVAVPWAAEQVDAIVQTWYPGQAGGQAIADVLFGDHNPSGRLPVTIYRSTDDLPPFDSYAMAGRTYRYFEGEPLYPFGHGLSYTSFDYADMTLDPPVAEPGDTVTVSVTVTNIGDCAGEEVVQLYVKDLAAMVARPRIALQGFARVHLAAGESRRIRFGLAVNQLGYEDEARGYVVAHGTVELQLGSSSSDLRLTAGLNVAGTGDPEPVVRAFFATVETASTG